jgi:hypothetical protein
MFVSPTLLFYQHRPVSGPDKPHEFPSFIERRVALSCLSFAEIFPPAATSS